MIELICGNILKADTEAVVNTVNCVGVMGKGLALQFKKAFPENFKAYEGACRHREIQPGRLFVFETGHILNPRYTVNFPTKRHWRDRSHYEDIVVGSKALVAEVRNRNIHSIAIPPLGCGLGGLDWETVRAIIEEAFSVAPDAHIRLFEPKGSPLDNEMLVNTAATDANSPNLKIS